MYRHLGLHRMPVSARLTSSGRHPTSHTTPEDTSAVGFASAVVLTTNTMVMGFALMLTAPHTVIVPIATVLGSGLIASALVAAGDRWLTLRRRTERRHS